MSKDCNHPEATCVVGNYWACSVCDAENESLTKRIADWKPVNGMPKERYDQLVAWRDAGKITQASFDQCMRNPATVFGFEYPTDVHGKPWPSSDELNNAGWQREFTGTWTFKDPSHANKVHRVVHRDPGTKYEAIKLANEDIAAARTVLDAARTETNEQWHQRTYGHLTQAKVAAPPIATHGTKYQLRMQMEEFLADYAADLNFAELDEFVNRLGFMPQADDDDE